MQVKNIVLLVLFILGIVFMQYIRSHSIDEIIHRYLEARGGKKKLKAIRSVYMEGTRKILDTIIPVKVWIVQDKLHRTNFEFENTVGYSIITPSQGWTSIPIQSQKIEPIPGDILQNMQKELDIESPMVDYAAKGHKAVLQGKEIINGIEAYKIKIELRTGGEIIYYIDRETNLLIQSRQMSTATIDSDRQEVITNYSDYKLFDGIMFPQTITNPGAGLNGGVTTFETILVNKPIDESLYKPSE